MKTEKERGVRRGHENLAKQPKGQLHVANKRHGAVLDGLRIMHSKLDTALHKEEIPRVNVGSLDPPNRW